MAVHLDVPGGSGIIELDTLEGAALAATAAARAGDGPVAALESALDVIKERLPGSFVAVLVHDHDLLWIRSARGYAVLADAVSPARGVVGRAFRTGGPQLVLDVRGDVDYVSEAAGVVSQLAMPLISADGSVIGILNLETSSQLPSGAVEPLRPLAAALTGLVADLSGAELDLPALARLFVFVGSLRDPHVIAEVAARTLARIAPFETCQVVIGDGGDATTFGLWQRPGAQTPPLRHVAARALRERMEPATALELLDVAGMRLPELAGTDLRSALVVPLRLGGAELGSLIGLSSEPITWTERQSEAAALLAGHAVASIDASLALSRERLVALTDPLTGLLNRRGFEPRLEWLLAEGERDSRPVSLVVLDCDDFKLLNDRAGHEQGDVLLRELGRILQKALGSSAEAGRLGGDEFVAVLPAADPDRADAIAAELVRHIASGLDELGLPLGVSAGVATFPNDAASATQLFRAADQALYEAKGAGKGRAVAFREIGRREGGSASDARESDRAPSLAIGPVIEAVDSLWAETDPGALLSRLSRSLAFLVGGAACIVSVIQGHRLVETARHTMRDVDLGEIFAYLVDEFPLTAEVLSTGEPRAISLLDDSVDDAEAHVLREIGMNSALLLRLPLAGRAWGLVELYERRLRRYVPDEIAVAVFIVEQAARRLEEIGEPAVPAVVLPTFRLSA